MSEILKYFQEKVVFLPVSLASDHQYVFDGDFEEYLWETKYDGLINTLHFKIKNPKGVIVYYHGNADNLERWGKIAIEFTKFGFDVLVMDYRGYGKSSGPRNEKYLYSDAQYCYNFAIKKYGEENTIVYGRSLGGAFATKISSDNNPKAIILEATFFNLQDVVNQWLPKRVTDRISPTMTYHFLSNENIVKITAPLFHIHGTKDSLVPLKSGKKLFDIFKKAQPKIIKKFIEIPGANHDDLMSYKEFTNEITEIFNTLLPQK